MKFFNTGLFFFNSYLVKKRTGINPDVLGHGEFSMIWIFENLMKVGLVLWEIMIIVYIISPSAISYFRYIKMIDKLEMKVAAGILMGVSCLVTFLGMKAMGDSWRVGIDYQSKTVLITSGIFQYVRNPIFLGMQLSFLGVFLVIPSILFLILLFGACLGTYAQTIREERYLMNEHGQNYARYVKRTGRFFPRILHR